MKMRVLLVPLVVVLVAADAKDDAKKEQEKFQGTWMVESATRGGQEAPAEQVQALRIVFAGDKVTVKMGEREDVATFTLDPSKKPAQIDIKPEKRDQKSRGIYTFEDGKLKVTWADGEKERPTDFSGKGDGVRLMVLKKEK